MKTQTKTPKLIAFTLPSHMPEMGGWGNGYVGIPKSHPLFEMGYDLYTNLYDERSLRPLIVHLEIWATQITSQNKIRANTMPGFEKFFFTFIITNARLFHRPFLLCSIYHPRPQCAHRQL